MKYHIFHDFRTSTPFKKRSSDRFKDLHKLKLLRSFDVSLASFQGVIDHVLLSAFVTLTRFFKKLVTNSLHDFSGSLPSGTFHNTTFCLLFLFSKPTIFTFILSISFELKPFSDLSFKKFFYRAVHELYALLQIFCLIGILTYLFLHRVNPFLSVLQLS